MVDDFEIVHVKKEVTEEGVSGSASQTGVEDLYDRFTQLIFLVDYSYSMQAGMAAEDEVKQYLWSAELLQQFRDALKKYNEEEELDEFECEDCGGDKFVMEDDGEGDGPQKTCASCHHRNSEQEVEPIGIPDDDEILKKLIVDMALAGQFKIDLPRNPYADSFLSTRSKIDSVKAAAKTFVNERFDRYPDASVTLVKFAAKAKRTSNGQVREGVLQAIDALYADGGDTQIVKAVDDTMGLLKKNGLGSHHIVLVTDGFDNGYRLMTELLPRMKELGVVLDFIFIIGSSASFGDAIFNSKIDSIREVCKVTGGEYKEVRTEKDFQKQFAEAANRKCLPMWKG